MYNCSFVILIDVTKESVKEILGFPLGRKQFSKLPFRTKEDKCYEEWTNQFDDKNMIWLQDIKMKIVSTNNSNMNFRMNFIALLINSLIESSSSGKANTNPLNYITSKTKIENIDWCSYLVQAILMDHLLIWWYLLYLDIIKSDVLKDDLGDFGTGDFNDEYVNEELNDEAYEQVVMNKYMKLDMLIEDRINKSPENITLNHLKISFDAIFKDKSEDNKEKKWE
uniref:Uncharacterized protein n=1 Tax=Lactuca sativa TaxID=4236 RepID=A0A9R1W5V2_LACSA|nr:hypothetical protein LSAT_V11C300128920 [Lactuca sativa]